MQVQMLDIFIVVGLFSGMLGYAYAFSDLMLYTLENKQKDKRGYLLVASSILLAFVFGSMGFDLGQDKGRMDIVTGRVTYEKVSQENIIYKFKEKE